MDRAKRNSYIAAFFGERMLYGDKSGGDNRRRRAQAQCTPP